MNPQEHNREAGAFTLVELLCVIAIIGLLAALLLPVLSQAKARAHQADCLNHLDQMGIAFHEFLHDHNSKLPMQVSVADGGSLEFVENGYLLNGEFYFGYRHFQTLSNYLVTPKLVVCPADTREPADNFVALANSNVSYFVGVKADYSEPGSILAGDRNVTNDWFGPVTLLSASISNHTHWTAQMHVFKGNLLFADGHVQESKNLGLALPADQQVASDWVLPSVENSGGIDFAGSGPAPANPVASAAASSGSTRPAPRPVSEYGASSAASLPQSVSDAAPPPAASPASTNARQPAVADSKPVPKASPGESLPATADDGMSPADRRIVQTAQGFIKAGGLFLLFLLLLIAGRAAYRRYRRLQQKKKRLARWRLENGSADEYAWSEAD